MSFTVIFWKDSHHLKGVNANACMAIQLLMTKEYLKFFNILQ